MPADIYSSSSALETQTFHSPFSGESANPNAAGPNGPVGIDQEKDLGFGSTVASQARKRLLNRDGSFNVYRQGHSLVRSRSAYHYLINASWPKFLLLVFLANVLVNFLFALAYTACGFDSLNGANTTDRFEFLVQAYFFSVQTIATVGYGHISPRSLSANIISSIETLFGLLGFAIATGLFFARFSRPTARIRFSQSAVMAPYRGISSLQFRIVNERRNQLIHLSATVLLSWLERDGHSLKRKFYDLTLERSRVMLFPLSWTIVHPIAEDSPLRGITAKQLRERDAEFLILLEGIDDGFSQTVYTRTSYKFDEIIWNARFKNILQDSDDGTVGLDLNRIDEIEMAV